MIKVLKPGFYSSIQDIGRIGGQAFGVPVSGTMDAYAGKLANALLGNKSEVAVLEITMTGATFEFNCSTLICITGADMNPNLNKIQIRNNKVVHIKEGDVLSFGKLNRGFRAYLAVFGGFKAKRVMGSYSMYRGITEQTNIKKGDALDINVISPTTYNTNASLRVKSDYINDITIEVFKGPEFQLLTEIQQNKLLNSEFTISKNNNRMAYQLNDKLVNNLKPIITSPVLPGTVQLTPSGTLIILMRDCQTTGGYPRVLQLKNMAINVLSQKFTGNNIRFKLIQF